jgi:hypothetical protein
VTGTESQSVHVVTNDDTGQPVAGADCKLTNNFGAWSVESPGTVAVRKSAENLVVHCEAENLPPGSAQVVSRVNMGMAGNVIFGGVVGAIIDHEKGTAYDYPSRVRVVFGRNRIVESDDLATIAAVTPAAAVSPSPPREAGHTTTPGRIAAGTVWVYGFTDRIYSRRQIDITVRVLRVDGSLIEEAVAPAASGEVDGMHRAIDTSQSRFVVHPLTSSSSAVELAPYLLASFHGKPPVELASPAGYPIGSHGLPGWNTTATVQGWEPVYAPTGALRALRVDVSGRRSAYVGGRAMVVTRFSVRAWYAPDVGRILKLEHRAWTMEGYTERLVVDDVLELLSYRPAS